MGDLCEQLRSSLCFAKQLFKNQDVIGVEVGVDEGEHANRILEWNEVKKLYLVDVVDNVHDRFKHEGDRVQFILKPSVEAAKDFKDNSLDFVYIDACHSYQAVMEDLNAWYPKVKIGGIICGHDFRPSDLEIHEGVAQAVTDFFSSLNIELYQEDCDFWGIKNV